MSKIDHSLFSAHEHALEHSLGECPECGSPLHIRNSKNGPFVGCSNYPECHFSRPLHDNHTTVVKVIEDSKCPLCASQMAVKKGRFGLYIGCTQFPDCHYIAPLKATDDTQIDCPSCHKGHLIERTNKYGKRFFACNHYPKCRYVLNSPPINQPCPQCGWGVMINKRGKIVCPQVKCGYQQEE